MKRTLAPAILAVLTGLAACDGASTNGSGPLLSAAEVQATLASPTVNVSFEDVAETFALGGKHTDLQRDLMRRRLTGEVVQWRLKVYEIQAGEGTYTITFQPVPIGKADAMNQVRAVAVVTPRGDADLAALHAAVTDSEVTVRGRVQDIALRTVVILSPAILVDRS